MEWFLIVLKKYAEFSGRARRKEYWMFVLISMIIAFVLGFIEGLLGSPGFIGMIFSLGILIPSIAVGVRRLHDTDRSGWWLLISFIPVIGVLVLLYFMIIEGTEGGNSYGPDPKQTEAES